MKLIFCDNGMRALINFRIDVIRHFASTGNEVVLIYPSCTHEEEREKDIPEGVRTILVDIEPTGMSPSADWKYFLRLYSIYRNERPDIVFHYTIKPNIYGSWAARLCGSRSVAMIPGLGYAFATDSLKNRLARMLYWTGLRCSDRCLTLNRHIYDTLLAGHYVRQDKLFLLEGGEGVDLDRFQPAAGTEGWEKARFLFIARILSDKGYREFAAAAAAVKKVHQDTIFEVLGPTDFESPMAIPEKEFRESLSDGTVKYLGYTLDVRPLVSVPGTVVVLPSNYHEGLSKILMEACAMGLPILTTDIPGCRETVDDGVNGFLFEPRSAEALSAAVERYLALSPDDRAAMGRASRIKAEKSFDVRKVVDVYASIADSLKRY